MRGRGVPAHRRLPEITSAPGGDYVRLPSLGGSPPGQRPGLVHDHDLKLRGAFDRGCVRNAALGAKAAANRYRGPSSAVPDKLGAESAYEQSDAQRVGEGISSARSAWTRAVDFISDGAHFVQTLSGRVRQLPIDLTLAREDGHASSQRIVFHGCPWMVKCSLYTRGMPLPNRF